MSGLGDKGRCFRGGLRSGGMDVLGPIFGCWVLESWCDGWDASVGLRSKKLCKTVERSVPSTANASRD